MVHWCNPSEIGTRSGPDSRVMGETAPCCIHASTGAHGLESRPRSSLFLAYGLRIGHLGICYNHFMPSYGVILLSGGLDSTTVAAYARDRVDNMSAITFHYGQTHSKEVGIAARIAAAIGIEQMLLDISFLSDVAWYSALINPDRFPTPTGRSGEQIGHGVPITYVPLRNTIFISLAAAYLESRVLYAIEVEKVDASEVAASVYLAPNALDYSGYPDCRPEFYENIRRTLELGSKLWTEYSVSVKIETPIIHLSKAAIAALGTRLGAPLEHTWSCYKGDEIPCGSCDSCILRAKGFAEAGIPDPLLVRLGRA